MIALRCLWGFKALFVFQEPLKTCRLWLKREWRPGQYVELRSGLKLTCSRDRDDVATLMEVLVKRDYGRIPRGGVVIDIGANIGVFSFYALQEGAARIFAFEPSDESYRVLMTNIQANPSASRIRPLQKVVAKRAGETVKFPVNSGRGNEMIVGENAEVECKLIPTTTLAAILGENAIDTVDLLKMDCEGAEKDIVLGTPDEIWKRVQRIRMEYHYNYKDILLNFLEARGFHVVHHKAVNRQNGVLWLDRPQK